MAILRRDDTITNALGNAIAGASVYYLAQPANVAALTPLLAVYGDTLGTAASNPQMTDGYGHAVAYLANGGLFTVVVMSNSLGTLVYPDQFLGSSSGSITTFSQVPTGAIDGTNTTFTLSVVPQLLVFTLNGIALTPALGYTLSGSTVTLASAPSVGDSVYAQGIASSGGSATFSQVPGGTINGANRTFTLTVNPVLLFLTYNGVLQTPGIGYTIASQTITMTSAPTVPDTLFAQGIA